MAVTIPGRIETINKIKDERGEVAAVLPIHYPRGLLRAFGYLPVEVWGPPGIGTGKGAAHLQPYVCTIVQNAMSFLSSGGLEVTELIVVPHACDSLQGLGSLLMDYESPKQPVIPFYPPRDRRESDFDFFVEELKSIYKKLKGVSGRNPSEDALMDSILREEEADGMLLKLHNRNQTLNLTNSQLYKIIRSREYLPAEVFSELAQEPLSLNEESTPEKTPIFLSGIVPEPMELFDVFTELDARVVGDDMATCGRRVYPKGKSEEPFRRMAERILNAPPDPTRGTPISERVGHLLKMVERTGAKGIVFYNVKFCEPELFDIPILRKELGEADVPSILIEVDLNDQFSQQVRTRLGAFLEMIQ